MFRCINKWGLRPAVVKGTKEIAPLTAFRDLDDARLLTKSPRSTSIRTCRTTNSPRRKANSVQVLGRQRIDPDRPHPFTAAGNTEFNA